MPPLQWSCGQTCFAFGGPALPSLAQQRSRSYWLQLEADPYRNPLACRSIVLTNWSPRSVPLDPADDRRSMDAFDADVLIYAATPGHSLGDPIRALFRTVGDGHDAPAAGVGSVLLLPELLSTPRRNGERDQVEALTALLGRLDLIPFDLASATLATEFGARYRLRAPDAVHLATAVSAGADRFITNNSALSRQIIEIAIVNPLDLL